MTRKTYITKSGNCPRCKFNDLVTEFRDKSHITQNIKEWYRRNTTYTEEQLKDSTHECNRCNIVFIVKKEGGYFSKIQSNGLVKCLLCNSFLCGAENIESQKEHLKNAHNQEIKS